MAKQVNYAESWYRVWCPECNSANWICNGNEQDYTQVDVEAIECRKCGCRFWLGPHEEGLYGDDIKDSKVEKGVLLVEEKDGTKSKEAS